MRGLMRVSVGLETTSKEVEALEQVFRWAEIPVLVDEEVARFSVDSPWIMYVSAPLAWFASRFARISPDAPAEVLAPALAGFVVAVSRAFESPSGSVVFTDQHSDVIVPLTPELPEAAYGALLGLDLPGVEGERIAWDEEQHAWYTLRGERCPER